MTSGRNILADAIAVAEEKAAEFDASAARAPEPYRGRWAHMAAGARSVAQRLRALGDGQLPGDPVAPVVRRAFDKLVASTPVRDAAEPEARDDGPRPWDGADWRPPNEAPLAELRQATAEIQGASKPREMCGAFGCENLRLAGLPVCADHDPVLR